MSGSLTSAGRSPTICFGSFGVGLVHAGDLALSVGRNYWQGFLLWQARPSWRENGPTRALLLQSGGGRGKIHTKPRFVSRRYMVIGFQGSDGCSRREPSPFIP